MCVGMGGGNSQQNAILAQQQRTAEALQRTAQEDAAKQDAAHLKFEQEKVLAARLARPAEKPNEGQEQARKDAIAQARRRYGSGNATLVTGGALGGQAAPGVLKTLIGE